jgi:undecaprenyl-diphosphatase
MHDPITYFQALILGIVQGLTEFLPISSSAHLLIVSTFAGWDDPGAAFTAVTQIGTETAVLIYFRHDIWRILSTWTRSLYTPELRSNIDARMGWYVIFGTLPIGFFGFVFSNQIETAARNLWLVATVLIVFGLALIPGVSRSGATISTGRVMGFDRPAATRYAFLLAIPAVLVSGVYEALKIGEDKNASWGPTILATIIAFFVGYAVIAWLIRYVSHGSFMPFVIYRVALGLFLFAMLGTGAITA